MISPIILDDPCAKDSVKNSSEKLWNDHQNIVFSPGWPASDERRSVSQLFYASSLLWKKPVKYFTEMNNPGKFHTGSHRFSDHDPRWWRKTRDRVRDGVRTAKTISIGKNKFEISDMLS